MSVIQSVNDTKDVLDFFKPQGLYLKPISRLNISVQLPQLKKSGAKISNWEVMEKVKEMARPFIFSVFKVAKSSLEFIRFEAEINNFGSMDKILSKLDMKTIKLSGFTDLLKIRAAEAKSAFPTRQEWDSFFRENKHMNEMKAGERPDTIYLQNLPTKWFLNVHDKSGVSRDKPSEYVLKKVFGTFGEIRAIDIPCLDIYRSKMKQSLAGIQTFSFGQDMVFDAYIQYKEYIGFVKAMNSLKAMKLLYKDKYDGHAWVANIKVDFDKTKHLAESMIKKRMQERESLIEKEREKEYEKRRKEELEELKRASDIQAAKEAKKYRDIESIEKKSRQMEREERRRKLRSLGISSQNEEEKIEIEERKLIIAQRKLESIRLLDELLERVKITKSKSDKVKSSEDELLKTAKAAKNRISNNKTSTLIEEITTMTYKDKDELLLRNKLVHRLKNKEVKKMEEVKVKILELGNNCIGYSEEEVSDESLSEEEEKTFPKKERKEKSKKKKKKESDKRKKQKREERRSKRELDSHISLAKKIADQEKESKRYHRKRDDEKYISKRLHEGYPDYRKPIDKDYRRENRESRVLAMKMAAKNEERKKEELYDKMVNPHLYGSPFPAVAITGQRRLRRGEHYEDVQKEFLDKEIKLREQRKRQKNNEYPNYYSNGKHRRSEREEYSDYRNYQPYNRYRN